VLLLGVGYVTGAVAPYFYDIVSTLRRSTVVQALARPTWGRCCGHRLLLALAIQAHKRFGTLDPQELVSLKG